MKRHRTPAGSGNNGRTGTTRRKGAQAGAVADPDWLAPEEIAELEEDLFKKGVEKYGFDEETAREWARAFCRDDEDVVQEDQHAG